MIAGGLDTTPACILLGIAVLSGPQGFSLQERLLDDIRKIYPDGSAWETCLEDEKCEYVKAFCKEVLRFWTVIPMSLPRVSIKDVAWQGATIPAGTTFLMVSGDPNPQPIISQYSNRLLHQQERLGSRLRRRPFQVARRIQPRALPAHLRRIRNATLRLWRGLAHVHRLAPGVPGDVRHVRPHAYRIRDLARGGSVAPTDPDGAARVQRQPVGIVH